MTIEPRSFDNPNLVKYDNKRKFSNGPFRHGALLLAKYT